MQVFNASFILSHFLRSSAALNTPLHAHVCILSIYRFLFEILLSCFALHDLFYCYHIDDQDGFCSLCALKELMEESIQRPGFALVPARFKDNLSSILWIEIYTMSL
jgi:hypothetical protein